LIEQNNGIVLDDIESDSSKQAFWNEYVIEGYKKGMGRAFDDVKGGYAAKFAQDGSTDDFYQGSKFEFLKSSFGQPETIEKIQLLAGRVFTDMKGVTDSMAAAMSRVLVDGLSQGAGPIEVADNLVEQVGISESRARMVARTELMRAHNEGALDAMEAMGVEEIGVMVEWSTGGHNVCPLCKALEGVVLTTKEARGMFPRHPNCKCVPIPANVGESTKWQKRSKNAIERSITRSIDLERPKTIERSIEQQRKRSSWQGADRRVAKKRPKSILDGE
jgi:SPP1 gp7 family putative phage head morphogenesis protein